MQIVPDSGQHLQMQWNVVLKFLVLTNDSELPITQVERSVVGLLTVVLLAVVLLTVVQLTVVLLTVVLRADQSPSWRTESSISPRICFQTLLLWVGQLALQQRLYQVSEHHQQYKGQVVLLHLYVQSLQVFHQRLALLEQVTIVGILGQALPHQSDESPVGFVLQPEMKSPLFL